MCDKAEGTAGYIIMHTCNNKENITYKHCYVRNIWPTVLQDLFPPYS